MTHDLISAAALKELAAARAIRSAALVGHAGGFALVVTYGLTQKTLRAKRNDLSGLPRVRLFSLDAGATFIRQSLGFTQFTVDLAGFVSTSKDFR